MKHFADEPVFEAEEGWVEFRSPFDELVPNFVSDTAGHRGLRAHYYKRTVDKALVGKAWFGPFAKGPPGHAHGGSLAALLDDAMGTAAWLAGYSVVAAEIKISFREMLPLLHVVRVEAWVEKVEGRKVYTRGKVFASDGKVFSEGSGLFIALTQEKLAELGNKR